MKICIEFFWIPSIHNFPRKIFTNLIKSILINLKRKSFDKVYLCKNNQYSTIIQNTNCFINFDTSFDTFHFLFTLTKYITWLK